MRKVININCWCKKYYVYPSHKNGIELANPYLSQPGNERDTLSGALAWGLTLMQPKMGEEVQVFFIDDNHVNYRATLISGETISEFIERLLSNRVGDYAQFKTV